MVPLAPGVFINPHGTAQLSRTAAPTPLKGPAKHGAFREAIAPGQLAARTPAKELGSDLVIEAFGPFHSCTEGLARFPGSMVALLALKASQMQPQEDRAL
jgi:hypothetical protein